MAICASCGAMNDDRAENCSICGQQILYTQPVQEPPPNPNPFPYASEQPPTSGPLYASYPVSSAAPTRSTTGQLPTIGMIMGIVVLCVTVIGLIPCLGWLNWFTVSLGPLTTILNLIAIILETSDSNKRSKAVIGLVLALVAVIVGGIRLVLGGGCI